MMPDHRQYPIRRAHILRCGCQVICKSGTWIVDDLILCETHGCTADTEARANMMDVARAQTKAIQKAFEARSYFRAPSYRETQLETREIPVDVPGRIGR